MKKSYVLPAVKIISISNTDMILTVQGSGETGIKIDDDFWTLDQSVNDSIERGNC